MLKSGGALLRHNYIAKGLIVLSILWQGSYFAVQYIFIVIFLLAFIAANMAKKLKMAQTIKIKMGAEFICLSGIFLCMLLSTILYAESKHTAILECIRYMILPCSYVVFCEADGNCGDNDKSDKIMKNLFVGCLVAAILGLMSYFDIIAIPASVIEHNKRLQSVFQYANAAALIMAVGIMYSAHYFFTTKKIRYPIYALIFFAALLLTGSRTSFALFLGIAVLFAALNLKKNYRIIFFAALIFTIALLIAFNNRITRISVFEPTLIERLITYQDAVDILKSKFLTGLGIGNWQEQQYIYQSAPYSVRYIHNYYLQLFLDGGIFAAAFFTIVIILALLRGFKDRKNKKEINVHFYIVLYIAAHIALDFDMCFGGIMLILVFSLSKLRYNWGITVTINKTSAFVFLPLIITAICALCSVWLSEICFIKSESYIEKGEFEKSMALCEKSLALNPFNGRVYYNMIKSVPKDEADKIKIDKIIKYSSLGLDKNNYDTGYMKVLAEIYESADTEEGYRKAAQIADEMINIWRYNKDYHLMYVGILEKQASNGYISREEQKSRLELLRRKELIINRLYNKYIAVQP